MANDKIQVHNAETGLTEFIELNDQEQTELNNERATWLLAKNNAMSQAREAKAAAQAKLAALGLTTDDLRALGL